MKHGRLVKSKWVYKVKYNDDNIVKRFRARLVTKGFTQLQGSDFYETHSPVFSYTSLRTFFAEATDRDLRLDQWDLKNSFIEQKLDVKHMYMECPDGYPKTMESGEPTAIHCRQSIYGLEQSSRPLHQRLLIFLRVSGFKQFVSQISASVRKAPATIKLLKLSFPAGSMISFWRVAEIIMLYAVGSTRASRTRRECTARHTFFPFFMASRETRLILSLR